VITTYTDREAFEVWAMHEGSDLAQDPNGNYTNYGTQGAWCGWRAHRDHIAGLASNKTPAELRHLQKQRAYQIDPECWQSYSGKPKDFKQRIDKRRNAALKQAEKEIR
jgi:hypothetical protein